MARTSVVQEYEAPATPTFTLDDRIQNEIEKNGIERPKGYTVSWHNNAEVEMHHFGQSHPMKPWRLTLTKQLVMAYGMHTAMDTYLSRAATKEEMAEFHKEDYLEFLQRYGGLLGLGSTLTPRKRHAKQHALRPFAARVQYR